MKNKYFFPVLFLLIIFNIFVFYDIRADIKHESLVCAKIGITDSWQCLHCGQGNPSRFLSCGNCGARKSGR